MCRATLRHDRSFTGDVSLLPELLAAQVRADQELATHQLIGHLAPPAFAAMRRARRTAAPLAAPVTAVVVPAQRRRRRRRQRVAEPAQVGRSTRRRRTSRRVTADILAMPSEQHRRLAAARREFHRVRSWMAMSEIRARGSIEHEDANARYRNWLRQNPAPRFAEFAS